MNQEIHVVIEHLRGTIADISFIMLAAGRQLAQASDGDLVAVILGHNAGDLARGLEADRVIHYDHPALAEFTSDAYLQTLSDHIRSNSPRLILLGHTTIGMDVASGLSARLDLPLISQCRSFQVEEGKMKFISQICGGKIMAEGEVPAPSTLITMVPGGYKAEAGKSGRTHEAKTAHPPQLEGLRLELAQYIEPEVGDVDITKEQILIAVGRGLQNQDDLELIQELAETLGGAVCASRPIVDKGWLPTMHLVGKSGKTVKPRLYIALGISGAPEHVEAITDSEVIVAINTDPDAPIFDVARYGVNADMLDFTDAFMAHLKQVQVG